MEFSHTGDDGLTGLRIRMSTECGILFSKLCERFAELSLSCLCLRLDGKLDNGLRELHRLKYYRMLLVTDRITCSSKLETYCCGDITRVNLVKFLSLVCVHLQYAAYTLLLAFCCVEHI